MKLIVGLGNPGEKYEKNRHNIGFQAVEKLAEKLEFPDFKEVGKFKSAVSEGEFDGEKLFLVKPQTFMNNSGEAVQKLQSYYKVDLADLWVVYDDVDLDLGVIRTREKGSAGTHNGMRSVVEHLGEDFPRFRFGINSGEKEKYREIADFVLANFTSFEEQIVKKTLLNIVGTLEEALKNGVSAVTQEI